MLGHSLSLNACRVYRKTALEDGLGVDADVIWADLAFFLAASTLPAYCEAFFSANAAGGRGADLGGCAEFGFQRTRAGGKGRARRDDGVCLSAS